MDPHSGLVTYPWLVGTAISLVGILVIIFSYLLGSKSNKGEVMTIIDHEISCKETKKEFRDILKEEFTDFKDYFDVEMENKVLKSLRNLNGTLEQKIADVVAGQVTILGTKLTDEINKKLDLVEILKHVVIKSEGG